MSFFVFFPSKIWIVTISNKSKHFFRPKRKAPTCGIWKICWVAFHVSCCFIWGSWTWVFMEAWFLKVIPSIWWENLGCMNLEDPILAHENEAQKRVSVWQLSREVSNLLPSSHTGEPQERAEVDKSGGFQEGDRIGPWECGWDEDVGEVRCLDPTGYFCKLFEDSNGTCFPISNCCVFKSSKLEGYQRWFLLHVFCVRWFSPPRWEQSCFLKLRRVYPQNQQRKRKEALSQKGSSSNKPFWQGLFSLPEPILPFHESSK